MKKADSKRARMPPHDTTQDLFADAPDAHNVKVVANDSEKTPPPNASAGGNATPVNPPADRGKTRPQPAARATLPPRPPPQLPALTKAWPQRKAQGKPVDFIGLDFKEGPEAGVAFERKYQITYPSLAYDGGRPVMALQGKAPAVPTTLVLDRKGRIAARILGQTTTATLTGLVDDVLAESPQQ